MVNIVGNARYPHAILLAPLVHKYRNALLGLFLPPDSPQLAPIERVWKVARRVATHHRYVAHSTHGSISSRRVSIGGDIPIPFCEASAVLFKTRRYV